MALENENWTPLFFQKRQWSHRYGFEFFTLHLNGFREVRRPSERFVEYCIHCRSGSLSWEVYRRYNEFAAFHENLSRDFENLPVFPPKGCSKRFDTPFLNRRMNLLETYIEEVLSKDSAIAKSSIARSFFGIEDSVEFMVTDDSIGRYVVDEETFD